MAGVYVSKLLILVGPPGFEPGTTSDPGMPPKPRGLGNAPQAGILARLDDGPCLLRLQNYA